MHLKVYLSGEIHTDWREEITQSCTDKKSDDDNDKGATGAGGMNYGGQQGLVLTRAHSMHCSI